MLLITATIILYANLSTMSEPIVATNGVQTVLAGIVKDTLEHLANRLSKQALLLASIVIVIAMVIVSDPTLEPETEEQLYVPQSKRSKVKRYLIQQWTRASTTTIDFIERSLARNARGHSNKIK